ncbi:MAG: sporulation protein [Defluviitaleaceae bacterium]|nr:sporulation protein [Defluviitaleaceae bacterium]MCL2239378.1 sporulation protein [Defluviitaleaceae bacterium]
MADSIKDNLSTLFSKMEDFVSTKTVVGEPVVIGDVILVPLVDVTFGMATGMTATDKDKDNKGGGGMGAKMTPSAVVVIVNGTAQLVNIKNQESASKLIDMIPGILAKLPFLSKFLDKKEEEVTHEATPTPETEGL